MTDEFLRVLKQVSGVGGLKPELVKVYFDDVSSSEKGLSEQEVLSRIDHEKSKLNT